MLHAVGEFGLISESFIAERMLELDRRGWEAWVATRSVANRDLFPFPPDERLLSVDRPLLARRVLGRLAGRYHSPLHTSWWMAPAIASVQPRLVHAHFGWTAAEVLPVVKQAGLPLVAGFHGYDLTVFPAHGMLEDGTTGAPSPRRRHEPYARLLREADRALVVSAFLEQRLRSLGFEGPVDVVPSGITLGDFPYRGPRPTEEEVRLLYVGRLVEYKGLDVLLRALARLLPRVAGVRLDVVGDGLGRPRYEALANELGVGRAVSFRGALSRNGVVDALLGADMLVAPSKTVATGQAEGLSNVTKEAMAVGLQVVATANGGLPETIPPRFRPQLVPEGDDAQLADRILVLLAERERWAERAAVGREWVEQTFDWALLAPRIASVYEEVTRA